MTNMACYVPCKSQSGFRRKHSTETAVTYFADENYDLTKAFDTVDHDILISTLKYCGVCDESLPWFENYFSERKQLVSIPGSLLFIVYINDLPRSLKHCSVNMYVENTAKYPGSQTIDTLNFYLNQDLEQLAE